MIELLFVIVIIGILSTFAVDIYINIYKNYVISRSINSLESRTEIAIEQIAARLSDRIHDATVARASDGGSLVHIDSVTSAHSIIEWIGRSSESRNLAGINAAASVGWSGFADMDLSIDSGKIVSLGSNLSAVSTAISSFTPAANRDTLGLIFGGVRPIGKIAGQGYGFNGPADNTHIMTVSIPAGATDEFTVAPGYTNDISTIYSLVHSAYAIVPGTVTSYDYNGDGVDDFSDFNLILHYNYQPWAGQSYNDAATSREILAENVTLFRFRSSGGSLEFKLCMRDPEYVDVDFIVCKSKVVF